MTREVSDQRRQLEEAAMAAQELERRKKSERNNRKTIFGIVNMENKVVRKYQKVKGKIIRVNNHFTPDVLVPEKMEPFLIKKKRFKIIIGGRGSGKSMTGGDIALAFAKDDGAKVGCFRQFQNSIDDSTYSLLKEEIDRIGWDCFNVLGKTIEGVKNKSLFIFKGLERNTESVKSMNGFNIFMIDEAQTVSEEAFRVLTPTLRTEDSEVWMFANPRSSADPFSERFINPYQEELDKHGYFEDENVMIIVCNYDDNPFFPNVLEQERQRDFEALPRAMYNHIWLGHHNDSVADAVIEPEWFEACIDAHKHEAFRKSMKPRGAVVAAHDVADTGDDDKAYALRHGSIIKKIIYKEDGDIADGAEWACFNAQRDGADIFTFDASGMGVGIRKDVNDAFENTKVIIDEHRGGSTPDDPNKIYDLDGVEKDRNSKTNAEIFFNKRSQYIWRLRDRIYNTYRVVTKGEYVDPDRCISFDSDGIQSLEKLRSEVCRQPLKPNANGLIQMMPKKEMKKMGIPSPNMLDAIAMTMITPNQFGARKKKRAPLKIRRISMC